MHMLHQGSDFLVLVPYDLYADSVAIELIF
ncbi:hypothetical protein AB7M22_001924 [Pseudomonas sp. ADAK2 TE3594]